MSKKFKLIRLINATSRHTKKSNGLTHQYLVEFHNFNGSNYANYINCAKTSLRINGTRYAIIRKPGGKTSPLTRREYYNMITKW